MPSIAFIDTEVDVKSHRILDIGCVKDDGSRFHGKSLASFLDHIRDVEFLCGHNVLKHDLPILKKNSPGVVFGPVIDTLYLSPLLFPKTPYHALVKDDKINPEGPNNPFNDAEKARHLFHDEVDAFNRLEENVKATFFFLLNETVEFGAFFKFIDYAPEAGDNLLQLLRHITDGQICANVQLERIISDHPIELAYAVSLIINSDYKSITPPWILKNFPAVDQVMKSLTSKPCLTGCDYCNQALDAHNGLKRFFKFDQFRSYAGQPLQQKAVKAAIAGDSILTVFPTGGGKSITFQLPALIAGETSRALTVIISPLQSLMKDQVDNLDKFNITAAVTINGLLDPIDRAKSFERVANGSASLLYISPESLRSPSITSLLLGRKIARFVIDEAHCFSAWGQDFRVDYLYIGDFLRELEAKKNLSEKIPVSCFTATAKQKVIEDIREYFREKNGLHLELFTSNASRTNLSYKVLEKNNEEEKYATLRDLIEDKDCPTIIYVSRTHRADNLAARLIEDGFQARAFHGKMDTKEKTANQEAFINGEVQIMVATSAFGMGVDKKDIGMVIHYEISDSLENYIQEAGRAGRDENMLAECFVLFNEDDLSKHFILLNQTKLSIKEIRQVWKAIKDLIKFASAGSNSALEIARTAGWDDNVEQIETRVTTAIAALEDAGYLKRGQNMPRIFATSILSKTAQEAIDKIKVSTRFDDVQKEKAGRIIRKLLASKNRKKSADEVGEARVDYISDHLGIVKKDVIDIIHLLREEQILADQKDLTAYIQKGENRNRSLAIIESFGQIEKHLSDFLVDEEFSFNIKELNERLEIAGCKGGSPGKIKMIINFWAIKNWVKRQYQDYSKNNITLVCTETKPALKEKMKRRHELATFIVNHLYAKISPQVSAPSANKEYLVEFSVHELKTAFERNVSLFNTVVSLADVEDSLFFLSRIGAIKVEGGFLVVYNKLRIERLEQNNKIQYKNEDYTKLSQFYEHRVQQIHIVGEYAKKMVSDYTSALQFVNDYFQLNFISFLNRYFPGSREDDIKLNITPAKHRQLFGRLSKVQKEIVDDKRLRVVVTAGPGSGKTRVLVHKLASLALIEDVKTDQMLMVTFSRAAANDFKRKLVDLIGKVAHYIEIKTFHAYCFDLLGKVGSLDKSENIIREAVDKIRSGEVERGRITKTVLVIDEAQDMDHDEFELVKALAEQNEEMKIIAVGDDDQNIYSFRKSDSKYMKLIASDVDDDARKIYELTDNYRSVPILVDFANQFVNKIPSRLKKHPITSMRSEEGQIKIVKYQTSNLITPLVNDLINAPLKGTTCVLSRTNSEASKITGLIIKHGFKAKLIQTNDGFNLYNLYEVRYFLDQLNLSTVVISDESWKNAKQQADRKFKNSNKLEILNKIIAEFEASAGRRKFRSDLEVFIRESKLEDFYTDSSEVIFVSTIHKSKGREFDNVFLMLDSKTLPADPDLRPLYVAITRAKNFLSIHTNGEEFNGIVSKDLVAQEDHASYDEPVELVVQLTLTDVILDVFIDRQDLYKDLVSGSRLVVKGDGCYNEIGLLLLKFSQKCRGEISAFEKKGYVLKHATVNFIVYWKKEGSDVECKVIVPELIFEKK